MCARQCSLAIQPSPCGCLESIFTLLMMEAPLRISSQAIKHQEVGKTTGRVLEISDALDYFSHT